MNETSALDNLNKFLEENANFNPTESFTLSEPTEHTINNEKIYHIYWTELDGRNARGGYSYYVMPDGAILMPREGSGQPETPESIYARWQGE